MSAKKAGPRKEGEFMRVKKLQAKHIEYIYYGVIGNGGGRYSLKHMRDNAMINAGNDRSIVVPESIESYKAWLFHGRDGDDIEAKKSYLRLRLSTCQIQGCEHPGVEYFNMEARSIQGSVKRVCQDCSRRLIYCAHCGACDLRGSTGWTNNGALNLRPTHTATHVFCAGCRECLVRNITSMHEGNPYCRNCYRVATGVVMSGYHGTTSSQRLIADKWTESSGRYIGFELEAECGNDSNRNTYMKAMKDHFGKYLRGFERDGSLSEAGGCEMVSQATGLHVLTDLVSRIPRVKGVKSHDTTTCGLHVHVSRGQLGLAGEQRLISIFDSKHMVEFLQGIGRREFNGYCFRPDRSRTSEYGPNAIDALLSYRRTRTYKKDICYLSHASVDFSHANTVEFRLFRGTLYGPSIAACIEFSNAVFAYALRGGPFTRDAHTPAMFMDFVNSPAMAKDTKWLRKYIEVNVPNNIARARNSKPLPEGFVGPMPNKKAMRLLKCA